MTKERIITENIKNTREKIKTSVSKTLEILGSTLGPRGYCIMFPKMDYPVITNDGISIAEEISFADPVETLIAKLIRESSKKTNDIAGDGTTTTAILACNIILNSIELLNLGYSNSAFLKRGLEKISNYLVKQLKTISIEINDNNFDSKTQIENIATISSGSSDIGKLIQESINKVGNNGIVICKDGNTIETTIDINKGMFFDKGLISNYFANSEGNFIADDCVIMITDFSITTVDHMAKILEEYVNYNSTRPLLIIADDVKNEALMLAVANKIRRGLNIAIVKAPSFGENKKTILEDLCLITGATLFSVETGMDLKKFSHSFFGSSPSVKITQTETTITLNTKVDKYLIEQRKDLLKKQIENSTVQFETSKLQERLAKLSGGIAVINVGAATETDMKSKKLKIEDALNATKSAIEEGIVPGCGISYIRLANLLLDSNITIDFNKILTNGQNDFKELIKKLSMNEDEAFAINVVIKSLFSPLNTILNNAGLDNINNRIIELQKLGDNFGYNLNTLEITNVLESGIIDPTKLVRSAIENSFSIAGMIINTSYAIADKNDDSNSNNMPGPLY